MKVRVSFKKKKGKLQQVLDLNQKKRKNYEIFKITNQTLKVKYVTKTAPTGYIFLINVITQRM